MASLPPGPRESPTWQVARWTRQPTVFLDSVQREFGDIFTLRFPGYPPLVVIHRPEDVKALFTAAPTVVEQGPFPPFIRPLLGDQSLFFLEGVAHQRERKLLLPAFHGERMLSHAETIRRITRDAINRCPRNQSFLLAPIVRDISLQVILQVVFGIADAGRLQVLHQLLAGQSEQARRTRQLSSVLTTMAILLIPGPTLDALYRWSGRGLDGSGRMDVSGFFPWQQAIRLQARMDQLLAEEILRLGDASLTDRDDVLATMAQAIDEDGTRMSPAHLRDEMVTFLVAGHETSATGLAWYFDLVLRRPDVLARLRDELDSAGGPAHVTPQQLQQLPWLDATLRETLRLRPVVPQPARRLLRDMPLGKWILPSGAVVLPSIYLAHRRAETYAAPDTFDPGRFLERRFGPNEFFPFGGGTRRCIGMSFAMFEMKMAIATLLERDLMHTGPPAGVALRAITMAPDSGVPVVIKN